jgi:hypothetical protein
MHANARQRDLVPLRASADRQIDAGSPQGHQRFRLIRYQDAGVPYITKSGSVTWLNVGFAPKATSLLRGREHDAMCHKQPLLPHAATSLEI